MGALICVALAALSWLLLVSLGPDFELGGLRAAGLSQLAWGLSAIAVVQLLQRLLSQVLRHAGDSASTDLLQAVLRIVLYLGAGTLYLRFGLGLDVSSVLATSAMLSVIVGLALQPTLGHLFAGISLEIERPLRVGDCLRREQLEGEVVSLNWRSVSLRTVKGSTVVLPNHEFTSRAVEVVPRGQPYRHEFCFHVAARHAPGQVIRCALHVLHGGVPGVCLEPLPTVLLSESDPRSASLRYSVRFFTLEFLQRHTVAAQVQERLWYALSREGLSMGDPLGLALTQSPGETWPLVPALCGGAATGAPGLLISATQLAHSLGGLPTEAAQALLNTGRMQRYGRGERCETPGLLLLVHGSLREPLPEAFQAQAQRELQALLESLSRPQPERVTPARAMSRLLYQELLQAGRLALGPVAEELVGRIAQQCNDAWLAWQALAASTPQPELRAQLLANCPDRPTRVRRAGQWAGLAALDGEASCVAEEDCAVMLWEAASMKAALDGRFPDLASVLEHCLEQALSAPERSGSALNSWLQTPEPASKSDRRS